MPFYNDLAYFSPSNDSRFITTYDVATIALTSGIYKCTLCGHEIVVDKGRKLPPDGDHGCKHATTGEIIKNAFSSGDKKPTGYKWRLVAAPMHGSFGNYRII